MIKLVMFDLDGTLVDSEIVILKTFKHVFDKYFPNNNLSVKDCIMFLGPTLKQTFGNYTSNPEQIEEMIQEYVGYYKTIELSLIKPFDKAKETLMNLNKMGIKVVLGTSKFLSSALPSLKFCNLLENFDRLYTLNDVHEPKPEPEIVFKAMEEFNLNANEVMMVGDMPLDILCGKNAGVFSVALSWSSKVEECRSLNPSYEISSLYEIIDIIKEIK